MTVRRAFFLLWIALVSCVLGASGSAGSSASAADTGWAVASFNANVAIQTDGSLDVAETIVADFDGVQRHGIVRDIPVVYDYDQQHDRVYDLGVESVTDPSGRRLPYTVTRTGSVEEIRVGDPNVLVSGQQAYVIRYRVRDALNGFADHDELFWNVTGAWPVPIERATAAVAVPGNGIQRITCFEGPLGSTATCHDDATAGVARFEATRPLAEGEQLTVVVGFAKRIVQEPRPRLVAKPAGLAGFVRIDPVTVALASLVSVLSSDPIVIEDQPPDNLRPAQIGLILDERADTLDATATIVDLAVRGYLTISEITAPGFAGQLFGQQDWRIERTSKEPGDLLEYEDILFRGLFATGSPVLLSALKDHFHAYLAEAEESLYRDATKRGWFAWQPDEARTHWLLVGLGVAALGVALAFGLGALLGAAIVAVPVAVGGVAMAALSPWMPRRTARGSELLRRALGFRQYVATAETSRQRFNEQQGIFAAYLPYAIVFHCVDKWARAFRDVDVQNATRAWYNGPGIFTAVAFSRSLQGFTSEVSSAIVSTPGARGASGFSGWSGGGGGGGSW